GDTALADKLAHLLAEQGIEVRQARDKITVAGKEVPAGSYAVSMAQPMKRMIRTLLDPDVPMEADFLKEQERRRKKKLRDEIYDVTGWSLPLQYNVECLASPAALSGNFTPVQPGAVPGNVTGKGAVAYLVPWGSVASARFTAQALREGLKLHTTDKRFTQNGRKFSEGTVIIKVKENASDVAAKVEKIARESGAEVIGTETGWVEEGVNFGSNYVFALRPVKIAMAWDTPTSSLSAGHTRYVIERQLGYPVTIFRTRALAMADLSKYHVLVLPDAFGSYANDLGPAGVARLKSWVASGGVLIGIGNTVSFLADPKVGLLGVQVESLARAGETPKKPEAPTDIRTAGKLITKQEEFEKAIQADQETPDDVAGVLVRAKVDTESWIGAGVAETVHVLVNGRNIYTPIKSDRGLNAAVYEAPDKLLSSGYLWEENRKQLAFKPFVILGREGRGVVVGFTADPNFRAYMDGLNMLFMNALLRGPVRTSRGFGEQNEW
nr:peptidase M14 [Bryobacter sp.]